MLPGRLEANTWLMGHFKDAYGETTVMREAVMPICINFETSIFPVENQGQFQKKNVMNISN